MLWDPTCTYATLERLSVEGLGLKNGVMTAEVARLRGANVICMTFVSGAAQIMYVGYSIH